MEEEGREWRDGRGREGTGESRRERERERKRERERESERAGREKEHRSPLQTQVAIQNTGPDFSKTTISNNIFRQQQVQKH